MSGAQRRKGRGFELAVRAELESAGLTVVKPQEGRSADDGDLVVLHVSPPVVVEVKALANLAAGVRAAVVESEQAAARLAALPVGVVKRPGVAVAGDQLAVMSVRSLVRLLRALEGER